MGEGGGGLATLSWELPYNDARRMCIMPNVSHIHVA